MNVVRNEFAKLRHLHIGAIAAMMIAAIFGLTLVGALSAATEEDSTSLSWALPLAGLSLAFPIVSPLLIAVIASRTIEVEHQSNGWLSNRTTGVGTGRLIRAKFVSTGFVVVLSTVGASIAAVVLGALLRVAEPFPAGAWFGFTASIVITNLAILAVHLVVSTRVDNQLIPLGLGVLGTVVAICASGFPSLLTHVTPWGYYSLASAADYRGEHVVTLAPSYSSIIALGIVGAAAFSLATARSDRQEVLA